MYPVVKNYPRWLALAASLLTLNSGLATAEPLPLYELGVGLAGLKTPHYLGAGDDHNLLTPIPYLVYRGEHLRVDRSGVKTFLVDEERFDFNISLGASLPVDSDDNDARTGMPDLDLLLEVGPTLRYTPWQSTDGKSEVRLDLPLRAAIAADGLDLDYQGLSSSPGIAYRSLFREWNWTASYAALFGDRRYHGYTYDVDAPYVTAERPRYRARAGYTGSRLSLSATRHFDNLLVGGFVRYYGLGGAANKHSPLVKETGNLSAGFMVVWFFKQSKTLVSRDDALEL